MTQKELAAAIVTDIAQGLQEHVYNRQEGNHDDPQESIVYATYIEINNLLISVAHKYEEMAETSEEAVDPNICANETKE